MRNHYEVLQVRPDADPEVIAAVFKALSKRYHPDVSKAADANRVMKEINRAYEVLSNPAARAEYDRLLSTQQDTRLGAQPDPHQRSEGHTDAARATGRAQKKTSDPEVRGPRTDGRFIAYDNGTVLDTRTNLMWAAKDNGARINWEDAKSYCENYLGGGYTDWRMPTTDELVGLYDSGNYKNVIMITGWWGIWASETSGSDAALFDFILGKQSWDPLSSNYTYGRALPVRSGK